MILSEVSPAPKLSPSHKRLLVAAYGFEDRSLGWTNLQAGQGDVVQSALAIKYVHPKGNNKIPELRQALLVAGCKEVRELEYNVLSPQDIESELPNCLEKLLVDVDEVIVDISAMTKLLILVCLCKLQHFNKTIRIVYTEAQRYGPSKEEYEESKDDMRLLARFPRHGAEQIIRMKCLSSIRMQGQPVVMVAFTSFNEQLVRAMLRTISPHRLVFINGRSPRAEFSWRERAMQQIHQRLIDEYRADNLLGDGRLLKRVVCLVDYIETIRMLSEIYKQFGLHERIICAATGSKMQTVGLFFAKCIYPDIHIEYPTPDSYFVEGMSEGVHRVNEVHIQQFAAVLQKARTNTHKSIADTPVL